MYYDIYTYKVRGGAKRTRKEREESTAFQSKYLDTVTTASIKVELHVDKTQLHNPSSCCLINCSQAS
jgi:hypothetical protein